MKTIKVVFILAIQIVLFNIFTCKTSAFTLNPSTGNFIPNVTQQISIIASPPDNSTAIQIRLTITGGVITNYVQPSSSANWLAIGTCTGDTMFTTTSICVDLAKTTGTISAGESLGYFTVTWGSSTSSTITMSSDNGYLIDDVSPLMDYRSGQGGYYTQSGPSILPTTSLEINNFKAINIGLIIIIIGLVGLIIILSDTVNFKYFYHIIDKIKKQAKIKDKNNFHKKLAQNEE